MVTRIKKVAGFNALSGLYLISTVNRTMDMIRRMQVSMPSRAYTSFLPNRSGYRHLIKSGGFNALSGLYLISTFNPYYFENDATEKCFNALSGLYLIST